MGLKIDKYTLLQQLYFLRLIQYLLQFSTYKNLTYIKFFQMLWRFRRTKQFIDSCSTSRVRRSKVSPLFLHHPIYGFFYSENFEILRNLCLLTLIIRGLVAIKTGIFRAKISSKRKSRRLKNGYGPCNEGCQTCWVSKRTTTHSTKRSRKKWDIVAPINCKTSNVIYHLGCKKGCKEFEE